MINRLKLRLARRWLNLVPTDELRDEVFSRALSAWYRNAVEVMLEMMKLHKEHGEEQNDKLL